MNQAVRALAAAVIASLALTGCAAQSPTDAATVSGVRIPESEIGLSIAALATATQSDPREIRLPVVNTAVLGLVAERLADAADIPLTDAARQPILDQVPQLQQIAQTEGGRLYVTDATNYVLVQRTMGEDAFLTECAKVDVALNPRYGSWIEESCQVSGDTGSLSRSVPTSAP